jgi:5'-deoxynucleotidase YfbR-like HD superfamily hydrolase
MKSDNVNNIFFYIRRLSRIHRFSQRITVFGQSVAEHCFNSAMYALIFNEKIRQFIDEYDVHICINERELIEIALCHDLEESFTGDIISPVKNCFNSEYNKISDSVMKNMYHFYDHIINLHKIYARKQNLESSIVKLCDLLDAYLFCSEQITCGNLHFEDLKKTFYSLYNDTSHDIKETFKLKLNTFEDKDKQVRQFNDLDNIFNLNLISSTYKDILDRNHDTINELFDEKEE